jgi:hypothetical protein
VVAASRLGLVCRRPAELAWALGARSCPVGTELSSTVNGWALTSFGVKPSSSRHLLPTPGVRSGVDLIRLPRHSWGSCIQTRPSRWLAEAQSAPRLLDCGTLYNVAHARSKILNTYEDCKHQICVDCFPGSPCRRTAGRYVDTNPGLACRCRTVWPGPAHRPDLLSAEVRSCAMRAGAEGVLWGSRTANIIPMATDDPAHSQKSFSSMVGPGWFYVDSTLQ